MHENELRGDQSSEELVRTIPQAAKEIIGLYAFFIDPKKVKVPALSPQYVEDVLEDPSRSYSFNNVILPSFPSILSIDRKILLEPVWEGNTGKIQYPYYLEPLGSQGIVIGKTGWESIDGSFIEAPRAYIAEENAIYKAKSRGRRGRSLIHAWENPFGVVDLQQKTQLIGMSTPLRKLIAAVRDYR